MIKSIGISRVGVSLSAISPVEVSENRQIAINNGSHLTILDPRLPSIQESINTIEGKKVLDPKGLFDINGALQTENMDSSQLNRFEQLSVESLDEPFNFGTIADPMIMRHKWSPIIKSRRDCYLGVLYNTSELLIFERDSTRQSDFKVKINVFDQAIKSLRTQEEQEELLVSRAQFLSLRVNDFEFVRLGDGSGQDVLFLLLATDAGTVTMSRIENNQLHTSKKIDIGRPVRKISLPKDSQANKNASFACVVAEDNAVFIIDLKSSSEGGIIHSTLVEISPKSRFMVSKVSWEEVDSTPLLTVASTNELRIYQIKNMKKIRDASVKLKNYSLVVGIVFNSSESSTGITIAHEDGSFESFKYTISSNKVIGTATDKEFGNFVSKSLYKFHMSKCANEKEGPSDEVKQEDNGEMSQVQSKNRLNELTRPYLNSYIEGDFINYGISKVDNIITMVYRIVPKNILNYTILSKTDFNVGFIRLSDDDTDSKALITNSTSLACNNILWFKNFEQLPSFPREFTLSEAENFIKAIKDFKKRYFLDINQVKMVIEKLRSSLYQTLVTNFTNHQEVKELQLLFNFNISILETFKLLSKTAPTVIKENIEILYEEQMAIERILRLHVYKIILILAKEESIPLNEYDKFLLVNYYLYVNKIEDLELSKFNIPSNAKINIKNSFLAEEFRVTVDDMIEDGDENNLAISQTQHKWSRCTLSFLPLVDLNNKTDELKKYNYVGLESIEGNALISDIIGALSYCIVTGNRKYHSR